VIGQIGQSMDGRIATRSGHSKYINGPAALDHLHRLRAGVDAIVVGVGTVIADDPQLTVRRCAGDSPCAVIIDPNRRMPQDASLFRLGQPLFIRRQGDARHDGEIGVASLSQDGSQVCGHDGINAGLLDPRAIVDALAKRGYRRILVEGGSATLSHFVDHGVLDCLHMLIAPMIIGSGKPGLELQPIDHLDRALRPSVAFSKLSDGNILCECRFNRDQADKGSRGIVRSAGS